MKCSDNEEHPERRLYHTSRTSRVIRGSSHLQDDIAFFINPSSPAASYTVRILATMLVCVE
ncbi:MAG: hypothetical protein JW943_05395 [Deltaproteobacteria bacterium]|nr:hypothetical protein [Deltaproteobacteria bacterium]